MQHRKIYNVRTYCPLRILEQCFWRHLLRWISGIVFIPLMLKFGKDELIVSDRFKLEDVFLQVFRDEPEGWSRNMGHLSQAADNWTRQLSPRTNNWQHFNMGYHMASTLTPSRPTRPAPSQQDQGVKQDYSESNMLTRLSRGRLRASLIHLKTYMSWYPLTPCGAITQREVSGIRLANF